MVCYGCSEILGGRAQEHWELILRIAQRIINSGTLEVVAHETYVPSSTCQEDLAAMDFLIR